MKFLRAITPQPPNVFCPSAALSLHPSFCLVAFVPLSLSISLYLPPASLIDTVKVKNRSH